MDRTHTLRRRWSRPPAVIAAAGLLLAACTTDGDDPEAEAQQFSSGDVVRLILGSTPGGGFDTQARLLQSYLDEALDEAAGADVRVVVENMPGAGHRIATEHVYNSPPDGTRMVFSSAQLMVTNEVVRGAEHTMTEMTSLASAGRSSRGVVVNTEVDWPGSTFADVVEHSVAEDVLISHPKLDADIALMQAIMRDNGRESDLDPVDVGQTAEQVASLLRGETEAALTTAGSLKDAVDDNPDELRMVALLGCERDELLPDVPTIVDQELPGAEEICNVAGYDDRVFLGPPDLPEETTTILRDALETALTNEEYLEQAAEARLVDEWISGDEVETLISEMVDTYDRYKDQLPDE